MIIKIVLLALVFAVVIVYLRSVNKEMAMLAMICAGGIMITVCVDLLDEVFSVYEKITELSGISGNVLKIVVKVTVLCYIIEFSAGVIEDFGLKSVADKLTLFGRIAIIIMSAPILENLIEIFLNLVQ